MRIGILGIVAATSSLAACNRAPPEIIVSGLMRPLFVLVDTAAIFWADQQLTAGGTWSIGSAPIGGGPPTILATHQDVFFAIVQDGSYLYWPDSVQGTIMRLAKKGGGAPEVIATGQQKPRGIAVDSANLYWGTGDGVIHGMPIGSMTPRDLTTGPPIAGAIASDEAFVFWVGDAGPIARAQIAKVETTGGVAKPVAGGGAEFDALVLDAKNVYWGAGNDINQAPKVADAQKVIASSAGPVVQVAIDGGRLYWVAAAGVCPGSGHNDGPCYTGTINSMSTSGGSVSVLASDLKNPSAIAVDSKYVYWTDTIEQAIERIPK